MERITSQAILRARRWTLLLPFLLALAASPARAQSQTPADVAFAEGRALLDEGRYREACDKFEQSQALDRSPGTLLNLGNCYEPVGDLVRALATFEQAFIDSQQEPDADRRQAWSDAARERIVSLGKRIPRLRVRGLPAGGSITIDAQPPDVTDLGVRVNPGHHVLEAHAPGRRPFRVEFDIVVGQQLAVNVPRLEPESSPAAAPLAPPGSGQALATGSTPSTAGPPSDGRALAPAGASPPVEPRNELGGAGLDPGPAPSARSGHGPWPWVLVGTGAALLGTGVATGLAAKSKSDQLAHECGGKRCDRSLEGVQDSARSLALVTDVLWITGAVAAGVGVTLFVLDSGDAGAGTALQAGCFDVGCGLVAAGQF
jgi:hypothetical protein